MTWAEDVRRANETLDWIEARQGPLKLDGYARVETTVGQVRAMAEGQDDARIAEIRAQLAEVVRRDPEWTFLTEDVPYLLARLDALAAEASDVARENEALIEEVKASGEQIAALAAERDAARAWSARWKDCARVLRRAARQQYESWQRACDDVSRLSADLDRTEAERDDALARLAAAEAAVRAVVRAVVRAWDCDHQGMCDCMYDAMDALRAALAGSREQAAASEEE